MATKNTYDVVLEKVGQQPMGTMKALCSLPGIGLSKAKGLVDKAPTTVAKGLDKDAAIALKNQLENLDNIVSIPGMETKTEAPATKKTTTTKKQTTKKSAPSSSKAATPSNDDFDAIFGGGTAQKTTKTTKAKSAPKATTKKASAASDEAFDEIFGDSTPKTETKTKSKKSTPKVVDKQVVIGEYFAELAQLRQGIKETGTYSGDGDMKPEIALAMYGDIDAVFSSFKRETLSGYMRIARIDLEKQYKKLNKKIEKMKKASRYDKAKKCFSDDDRLVPCVSYELAMLNLRAGMPDSYINMMTTTALDGDPRAITYCQDYFSTNSEKANPYSVAIEKHNIRLNGKFDFYEMFFYAIRGIGFDYSPYYPDSEIAIPGWEFGRVNIEIRRTEALKKLYQTLSYFVIPENIGTAEYKEHFGDFMPSELQIKIARHWFFIEDDRLVMSDETKKLRDELRTKITDAICGAPQKSAKANDQKAPAASAVSAETESAPKAKIERVEYDNGSYEGEMVNGSRHGKGKYTWNNGSEYEGDWVNGKRCGFGVYRSYSKNEENGTTYLSYIYEGEWKDSKQHGYGVAKGYKVFPRFGHVFMKWSYDGPWVDDKKHGRGVYRDWDGNALSDHWKVYEGEWIDDKRHGLFVWRPEPAAKDLKYIDYYEHGKEVVGYIDYDPSIKTLEDAQRAKETEREENERVMNERRAREAAEKAAMQSETTATTQSTFSKSEENLILRWYEIMTMEYKGAAGGDDERFFNRYMSRMLGDVDPLNLSWEGNGFSPELDEILSVLMRQNMTRVINNYFEQAFRDHKGEGPIWVLYTVAAELNWKANEYWNQAKMRAYVVARNLARMLAYISAFYVGKECFFDFALDEYNVAYQTLANSYDPGFGRTAQAVTRLYYARWTMNDDPNIPIHEEADDYLLNEWANGELLDALLKKDTLYFDGWDIDLSELDGYQTERLGWVKYFGAKPPYDEDDPLETALPYAREVLSTVQRLMDARDQWGATKVVCDYLGLNLSNIVREAESYILDCEGDATSLISLAISHGIDEYDLQYGSYYSNNLLCLCYAAYFEYEDTESLMYHVRHMYYAVDTFTENHEVCECEKEDCLAWLYFRRLALTGSAETAIDELYADNSKDTFMEELYGKTLDESMERGCFMRVCGWLSE